MATRDPASPRTAATALAALSLDPPSQAPVQAAERTSPSADKAAVGDDELEAFRRAWRAEVQAKRAPAADVDAGGVRWKGKDVAVTAADKADSIPEPRSPPSPKTLRSPPRSPTTTKAMSPTKPAPAAGGKGPPSPRATKKPPPPPGAGRYEAELTSDSDEARAPSTYPIMRMPFAPRGAAAGGGEAAVGLYARAVEAEQAGKLSDALHLYRRAFRADDNADRLYAHSARKAEAAAAVATAPLKEGDTTTPDRASPAPTPADIVDPSAPEPPEYKFTREVQVAPDYERGRAPRVSKLSALLAGRKGVVDDENADDADGEGADPAASFRAADENVPLPLATIPAELLDRILTYLDVGSVERFAAACWRARLLTSDCALWRRLAERIYSPPMVPELGAARALARRHAGEYRTTLVEEERLRMDGAYIAVCHYIRPGAGEQWVTITHMITYHRFLRFYPDGTVISFLTTDHPSDVVPLLKPSLRAKGLHLGRWRLIRSNESDHADVPAHKKRARVLVTDLLEPGTDPRYEFEMELTLRETGRGRWNKLDLTSYSSINLATGEALGLSLKHQKPFYFSKVRSYHPTF